MADGSLPEMAKGPRGNDDVPYQPAGRMLQLAEWGIRVARRMAAGQPAERKAS